LATPAFFFSLTMKYSCLPDHSSQGVITRVSTYLAAQIRRTTSQPTTVRPEQHKSLNLENKETRLLAGFSGDGL
jgi:hypothetical protein